MKLYYITIKGGANNVVSSKHDINILCESRTAKESDWMEREKSTSNSDTCRLSAFKGKFGERSIRRRKFWTETCILFVANLYV